MAKVASCPQCQEEMLVPEGASAEAWAKCPSCRAFFQIGETSARELPAMLLVDGGAESQIVDTEIAPAADATSSREKHQAPDDFETQVTGDDNAETVIIENAADLEAAAQRIDAWFKSAKTLPDVPAIAGDVDGENAQADQNLTQSKQTTDGLSGATIELEPGHFDELEDKADFELEPAEDSAPVSGPWDDSKNMEQLWTEIEPPKQNELAAIDGPSFDAGDESAEIVSAPITADNVPPLVTAKVGRPRKRSFAKTLILSAAAGVIGLGVGYYVLLWLRGESGDFLNLAQYLPPATLPAEFQKAPERPLAKAPTSPPPATEDASAPAESAPMDSIETALVDSAPAESTADDSAPVESTPTESAPEEPAEVQVAHTEPVEPIEAAEVVEASPEPSRYDIETPTTSPPPAEPAAIEAPTAVPLAEPAVEAKPIRIENAPTFTTDELNTAMQGAKDAQTALMTGALSDGSEVQRAKGRGYLTLADLAQKLLFVDSAAGADSASSVQSAEQIIRETLSNAQTRGEIAQIVPQWIASPNRKHGGVFFAANMTSQNAGSDIVEYRADLDGGKSLTVLAPATVADQLASGRPVGVVGWIVDRPADQIPGYLGSAERAIWAGRVLPLE